MRGLLTKGRRSCGGVSRTRMEGPLLWHLVASCPVKGVILGVELSQTWKEQTAGGCVLITRPVTSGPFFLGSTPTCLPQFPPPCSHPVAHLHPGSILQDPGGLVFLRGHWEGGTEEDKLLTCRYRSGGRSSLSAPSVTPICSARKDGHYVNHVPSPLCVRLPFLILQWAPPPGFGQVSPSPGLCCVKALSPSVPPASQVLSWPLLHQPRPQGRPATLCEWSIP